MACKNIEKKGEETDLYGVPEGSSVAQSLAGRGAALVDHFHIIAL